MTGELPSMIHHQRPAARPRTAMHRTAANLLFVAGIAAALIILGPLYALGAVIDLIRTIGGGGRRTSLNGAGQGS